MPDGFRIAEAYVVVSPDLSEFEEELKAKLDAAMAGAEAKAKIGLDAAELDAGLDEAKAKLDEFGGKEVSAKLALDKGEFDATADEASGKLDEFDGSEATAKLGLDKADFDSGSDDAKASLDDWDSKSATPKLALDKGEFDEEKDAADERLDENDSRTATPHLDLNKDEFDAEADDAEARLDDLEARSATVNLGGSGGGSGGGGGKSGGMLGTIGAITTGIGALTPGIGGAVAGLGLLGGVGATAFGGVASALSAAHQSAANLGQTSAQTASTQFSNAVAAQQAAQQVGQAQQQQAQDEVTSAAQIRQAEQSVTEARQQAASDAQQSAESIESAQANLASAERSAAQSEVQALQQVTQAQQGVEEANFSLSQAQYQLTQAWQQAKEQVTQLTDALSDAKLNTAAASLAVQQAEQNELTVAQNAYSTDLDRKQATLAVAQAKQQLQDATDSQSSAQVAADEKQQSSQEIVTQAKQQVTQATYGQKDAQTSLADADQNVTNTQINNAAAVKAAQLALTEAQQQAAQTQVRDGEQITQAEQSLSSAQEQAAYQQKQDAQAVSQAQQNLTNTLKEQQLQQAATASTANQAANQFAADMAKLTPAGRAFVDEVLSMKGAWKGFSAAIQEAVLPGATVLLKGLSTMFPELQAGAVKFGQAMGSAFASMGKEASTKGAHDVLAGLIANGTQFAQIVLPAMDHFVGSLAELGAKKGAVQGVAGLLAGAFNGLAGFAKGLGPAIPDLDKLASAAGKVAQALGPALAQDIGLIAKGLVAIGSVAAPVAKFFGIKPSAFISGIAQAAAALVLFKGTMKILPDAVSGPLGKLAGKVTSLITSPFRAAGSKAISVLGDAFKSGGSKLASGLKSAMSGLGPALNGVWSTVGSGFSKVFGEGGAVPGMIGNLKGMVTGLPEMMSGVVTAIKGWGIWSSIASAATKVWSGIQAAFDIVMDANPIILVTLAVVAIGVAVVEAYKHFAWFRDVVQDAFKGIETAALFMWHNVFDPMWQGIEKGAEWLYNSAIKPYFDAVMAEWHAVEDAANWLYQNVILPAFHGIVTAAEWLYDEGIRPQFQLIQDVIHDLASVANWLWNNVFTPVFHGIASGAESFVSGFKSTWSKLESIFKTPVNFLIKTVYDDGIRKFWNDVVGAVGLKSLDLPSVAGLARGGVLPGYAPGHDSIPAMLSPGESVLTPGATRELGAGTVMALNARNQPSGGGTSVKGGKVHAAGGLLGDITGLVGGAVDTAKIVAALATGNTTALTNALDKLVGTDATASGLAKVMISIPNTLAAKMVQELTSSGGTGGVTTGTGKVPGNVSSWISQGMKAAGVSGADWSSGLEIIAMHESGGNATIVNTTDSNARAGTPSAGLMQFIEPTFAEYAMPGYKAWMNPVDQVIADAWAHGYIKSRYGSIDNVPGVKSVRSGGAYVGYDGGGILPPGPTLTANNTGQPEAVLTAQQWQDIHAIAMQRGASGQGITVVNQYSGTQIPTPEQQAIMDRRMALQLSGGA